MKKNRLTMFAFAAMASIAIALSSCGGSENKEAATETPAAEVAINTTHKYVCPMNCEGSASNEPGKCVVCGMDLVENPNYAGTEATADTMAAVADTAAATEAAEGHDHEGHDHEGHNH